MEIVFITVTEERLLYGFIFTNLFAKKIISSVIY